MNFLFGKAERANGVLSNAMYRNDVEDSATVVMTFPGGVHGVVDVRWNSRIERDQFRVIGSEGELGLDPLNGPELRIGAKVEMLPPHPNLHFPLVANFVDAIVSRSLETIVCPPEQGQWVDWTIEQVVRSQR